MSLYLLKILVFCLPFQLGLHFWPPFSRVAGIRVDYLSPTLYLTDILLLLYLLLNISPIHKFLKSNSKFVILTSCFMILNIYFSISPLNSLFWWLRTLLYILFTLSLKLSKTKVRDIITPLSISTTLVVSIQFCQFITQSSLGGITYYLGERFFSPSSANLPHITVFDEMILRVPSIFSHANSLAGYLLLVYIVVQSKKLKFIVLSGLFLTFSRTAILALIIYSTLRRHSLTLVTILLTLSFIVLLIPIPNFKYLKQNYSIQSRLELISQTKKILTQHPVFGVGLGNFIPAISYNLKGSHLTTEHLQPVHNLLLLSLSELGYAGIIILTLLINKSRKILTHLSPLILVIAVTGFFDHYWLTLVQNRLLLSLLLGLIL